MLYMHRSRIIALPAISGDMMMLLLQVLVLQPSGRSCSPSAGQIDCLPAGIQGAR